MFNVKDILEKIVFLVLLSYFLVRVYYSYESLKERKIGTSTEQKFSENRDYLFKELCHKIKSF